MKTLITILLFSGTFFYFSQGVASKSSFIDFSEKVKISYQNYTEETILSDIRFIVHLDGPDCPALEYCVVKVVLYYQETMAEIGSQDFKYGEDEYIFDLKNINNSYTVCFDFQIDPQCPYSITVTYHGCVQGPFNDPEDIYPEYECD